MIILREMLTAVQDAADAADDKKRLTKGFPLHILIIYANLFAYEKGFV